jgi:hypothetical protein
MSDLRDLRAKITVLADAVLDSVAADHGVDKSEVVRSVLHRWALDQQSSIAQTARLLAIRLKAEGLSGESGGNGESLSAAAHTPDLEVTGVYKTLKKY